jgi:hypothetical protein
MQKHQGRPPIGHFSQHVVECGDSGTSFIQNLKKDGGKMSVCVEFERAQRRCTHRRDGLHVYVELAPASQVFQNIQVDGHSCRYACAVSRAENEKSGTKARHGRTFFQILVGGAFHSPYYTVSAVNLSEHEHDIRSVGNRIHHTLEVVLGKKIAFRSKVEALEASNELGNEQATLRLHGNRVPRR